MTNITVRACAPGLPTPSEVPQAVVTSRRAFLAIASAAAVASGSSAASAHMAASLARRPHVDLPAEHPRLIEIGAQLSALLDRHAEADSALEEAEAKARSLCPPVPACLKPGPRHPDFLGSARLDLDPEVDALGKPIGPFQTIRGTQHPVGTVASTDAIAKVIENAWDSAAQAKRLKPLLAEAQAYEAQRAEAIAASGLPRAIADLNAAARDLGTGQRGCQHPSKVSRGPRDQGAGARGGSNDMGRARLLAWAPCRGRGCGGVHMLRSSRAGSRRTVSGRCPYTGPCWYRIRWRSFRDPPGTTRDAWVEPIDDPERPDMLGLWLRPAVAGDRPLPLGRITREACEKNLVARLG